MSSTAESDPRALQELVDDVSDLLQAPATLEDTGFALVAYGSHGADGVDQVRAASILRKTATAQVRSYFLNHGIASATQPVRIPADESQQIAARVCIPARSGGRTHGYLWVVEPATGVAAQALTQVAPLADRAGALLARRAGVADEREALVGELLRGDALHAAGAWRRLVALGELAGGEALVVAVIRAPEETRTRTVMSVPAGSEPEVAARRMARRLPAGAVAGVSDAHLVRFNEGTPVGTGPGPGSAAGSGRGGSSPVGPVGPVGSYGSDLGPAASGAAGPDPERPDPVDPGSAGPGPVGVGAEDHAAAAALVAAARQAEAAAATAGARPHLGPVLSWVDLGFYRVLAQGPAAVEALIAGTPAARLREKADADLIRTALVWLDSGGNAARTAATLSVHRQTLYYRLERIEQMAGVDLDEGEARLGLHLGLALSEVLAKYQG
ncbi:helix-turn-helix domain-containing protein [Kineosporia sp. NBRC 101731]|uniref:PucR family transcriptional regulator n=1 Tax=Kineosporia sp. NBRC 101731 TaxID=3032199 RepID=UPI0024A41C32|nr:helix-turn-helix domain-containing protein [Kineosporia sp. NBRC 101731]GLY27577.1 transcriptional regulator [Kineosporia sp. NBRC 101731]